MLYVFHVDVGRMLSFDMTVALSSVENLKNTIERLHGIPAANIVLLVSGGEMLLHNTQVSYYSAGTDTNPIYMFLKGDLKLPSVLAPLDADLELKEQVERCIELPAVYETVIKRAQIALRMYDLARDEDRMCERLVHEQHLQQQGWSAVVANLEDLTEEFHTRFQNFCVAFDSHLERRSSYLELLRSFSDDLSKLSRIPILPGLMPLAEADFHGFDDLLENDDVFSTSTNQQQSVLMVGANAAAGIEGDGEAAAAAAAKATEPTGVDNIDDKSISSTSTSPNKKLKMANDPNEERVSQSSQTSINSNTTRRLNLLQWITSKENHNVLRTMSEECIQGLSTFNEDVYAKLKQEVENIIKLAKKGDVKEIRGLGERLCKLEELKYKIKNMVKDQKELSTAFQQNQNRAINLRDASILPDLCASHQSQLLVMIQNHKKIREHRHCIAKAKDELGNNLNARLGRIVYIENAMSEFDNRLLFYHRCLRRAERHIHIIEQIHQAPNMYVAAVTEVMRRNIFSTEFRLWASKLAEDFDSIHREEMKRRQQFNTNFEGHFLNILFPGMADMPPAFANENPIIFDARLPNITRSDIDVLTSHLPEMATEIHLPDMEPVIYFFVSRSGTHQRDRFEELLKQKQKRVEEELKQVSREDEQSLSSTTAMVVSGKLFINARLSELRKDSSGLAAAGEDSETDTETEFEQVPRNNQQSIATSTSEYSKISKSTATDILITRSAETLTDENSETLKKEVTRMRVMLGAMSELALECIQLARSNLLTFREEHVSLKDDLQSDLQTLNDKWNVLRMQCDARELEVVLQQANQEKEILRLQDELKKRECELLQEKELNHHLSTMKIKCFSLEVQVDELKNKLAELENEKEQAVIDTRDKLIHEHKTEIESLRQRFKLMTSMDRSPSDLSLESIASNEHVIEKHVHDTILSELRCELENEKERAITAAMEMERSIWQSKIFPLNSESVMANVGILKDMIEERERQLEQLREKDLILTKENYQLKTRLDALTNEEGNSWLKEKIDYLNRDKCRLEEELTHEKSKRLEMESSFAALKCSTYEQSASSRSKSTIRMPKYIALESCVRGDLVLVVWSMRHGQFVVLQDSPSLYFLHADSLPALNLRIPQASEGSILPMPFYAIGHVLDKEYCQAKKDENRYRVNRGSRFYRIKVTPYVTRQLLRRERLETLSTSSISRSISRCQSEIGQMTDSTESSTVSGILPYLSSMTGAFQADVLDGTVASPVNVINVTATPSCKPLSAMLPFKERTMSITSVSEEDDELVPTLSASSHYISAGDEDDNLVAASPHSTAVTDEVAAAVKQDINLQLEKTQTTVITEQPTAKASTLWLDLMLASADINTTTEEIDSIPSNTQNDSNTIATNTTTTESIGEPPEFVVSTSPKKYFSFVLRSTPREDVDDSSQDSDEFGT